ncbi:formimidoylglutamase [Shewanella surugensis]|uniref:Formimidoylglutamase n=1 Tax=Shewanella surugensis TaxID=212020 RepID=A0ABT0LEK1_9GAMM|nr:formimidoylglutamase [Shewanella surugensis]MCL1126131.1 formimidoylglutamase [Shewanella surugensis]
MQYLDPFTQPDLSKLLLKSGGARMGETKLGQVIHTSEPNQTLNEILLDAKSKGVRFVILGIGEDIGPRANLGRGGATDAFDNSISHFINIQSNRYFSGIECLILGQIKTDDLQNDPDQSISQLRKQVEQLDERVIDVLTPIIAGGLEPIVIGGGHNNAYGLLMATKAAKETSVAAINLDPHCDFRLREGRHSGNGFSYAAATGALSYYHVLGLHELKNTEASLEQLTAFGGQWHSLQQIWIRREISLENALREIKQALNDTHRPVALELDLDAIINMPSSASTAAGIPLMDALYYVHYIAKHCPCAYLHLAEAAPSCHLAGIDAGYRVTGQSISELMLTYMHARLHSL